MSSAQPPRVLIEDWLPAAAIGVECMRERGSASALAPTTFLHIWWARKPLCIARAAVLGSLLPEDFPHEVFERLLGFGKPGKELVRIRQIMDTGRKVKGGFNCNRAFKNPIKTDDLVNAQKRVKELWNDNIGVIDPMAGGGSIPLESARLGFTTIANEYNPVGCSILEATVLYPFVYKSLGQKTKKWANLILENIEKDLESFYPKNEKGPVHAYIYARTVPCPDTEGNPHTPLIHDWHLLKPKDSYERVWAEPIVDINNKKWSIKIIDNRSVRPLSDPPKATYKKGSGISLFSKRQIPADYIKAKAQAGQMHFILLAIAVKTHRGIEFFIPDKKDIEALEKAKKALGVKKAEWERENIIPVEEFPIISTDPRPILYGMPLWTDMFTPRQLLSIGTISEHLKKNRTEIINTEGEKEGNAIIHLLAFTLDKFLNHNCMLTRYENTRSVVKGKMDRHDYAFKPTFAELSPCSSGLGYSWAIDNVIEAYDDIESFLKGRSLQPVKIFQGSATNLSQLNDKSLTTVVVDPPYADNVQYSELADFFYVWLKCTIGYQHPEWFSTYLCDHTEEAIVNTSWFQNKEIASTEAKKYANEFYQRLMTETFKESHRILRDDGVLTVMFTHKKQEAWESLFNSLIKAGFTITATWPVKTESEHSLHQAKKNAAQSTVILIARKRSIDADVGYYDSEMRSAIRNVAQKTAERLQQEGLNPVDQLVGSFGPAIEVFSRHNEVKTDMGDPVGVDKALDEASKAVTDLRIQQLAKRGLEGVESEGRFYLLCWDVLQAAEFRFNEAKLLGHAVGMDVDTLVAAGLVSKTGDKIKLLSAKDRRRAKKLEMEEVGEALFGALPAGRKKRVKKGDVLKVHPNDPHFRTALDGCHALALRYIEAGGGAAGIGAARQLAVQQGWKNGSPVGKLMEALIGAAPPALWFEKGKTSAAAAYPEFRAWYDLLEPLFGIVPPIWKDEAEQSLLETFGLVDDTEEGEEREPEEEEEEEGSE